MNSGKYNRNSPNVPDRTITKIRIADDMRRIASQRASHQDEKDHSGLGSEADFKGCLGEVIAEYWMEKEPDNAMMYYHHANTLDDPAQKLFYITKPSILL